MRSISQSDIKQSMDSINTMSKSKGVRLCDNIDPNCVASYPPSGIFSSDGAIGRSVGRCVSEDVRFGAHEAPVSFWELALGIGWLR